MSIKTKQITYKSCLKSVADIDETKGIVKFYASIFGNVDRVGDIVQKGAYEKTLKENFSEIQHYKNHDSALVPGVIIEMSEDTKGLVIVSKLMLKTQVGSEVYEYYKAMSEAGKKAVHSIGYVPVKEKQDGAYNLLQEIYLQEVSTLTKTAANPQALTIDVKSLENFSIDELIQEKIFFDALLNGKFENVELEILEKSVLNINKAIESRQKTLSIEPSKDTQNVFKILNQINL